MKTEEEKKHYVYFVKYRGIIVYIGCGKNDRFEHARSGVSQNKLLNEIYYRGAMLGDENVEVVIQERPLSEQDALKKESAYIMRYQPVANLRGNSGRRTFVAPFLDELVAIGEKLGLSCKINGLRFTSDTRLLLTQVGCPFGDKTFDVKNSVYERVSGVHPSRIKLKDEVYKCLLETNPDFAMYRDLSYRGHNIVYLNGYEDRDRVYLESSKQASLMKMIHRLNKHPIYSKFKMDGRNGEPVLRCITLENDKYVVYDITEKLIVKVCNVREFACAYDKMGADFGKQLPKNLLAKPLYREESL